MYYILTSEFAVDPIFCVKEPALKILEALAKVEDYYLLEVMDEHNFTTIAEIVEYIDSTVDDFSFEDYWSDIYSGDITGSEEPVEATYDTDKVIDIYASGVDFLEAQETCISENFPFDEVYIPPPAKKEPYAWLNFLFPLVISLIIIGIFSDL